MKSTVIFIIIGAALAAPALAQTGAYHLILYTTSGGVAATPYPSKARCEAAREVVQAERKRRLADARARLQPGETLIGVPITPDAFCIPA